eukprot:4491166-Alexandrium_andersonii.AAC.1
MSQLRLCAYCAREYTAASTEGEQRRRPRTSGCSRARAWSTSARRLAGEFRLTDPRRSGRARP